MILLQVLHLLCHGLFAPGNWDIGVTPAAVNNERASDSFTLAPLQNPHCRLPDLTALNLGCTISPHRRHLDFQGFKLPGYFESGRKSHSAIILSAASSLCFEGTRLFCLSQLTINRSILSNYISEKWLHVELPGSKCLGVEYCATLSEWAHLEKFPVGASSSVGPFLLLASSIFLE